MKKYDRETKKWVDADVLEKRMNKRNTELCKAKNKDWEIIEVNITY